MADNGHKKDIQSFNQGTQKAKMNDFVLEKGIFSNVFEKDIRRVYIYKKAERLAKAIHLVGPAFANSPALRERIDRIAIGLVDGATLPPSAAREALSRELLALSSVLGIAQAGSLLSSMNAELIAHEAQTLLSEVATYEEPRLFLEDAPSLAMLLKGTTAGQAPRPVQKTERTTGEASTVFIKDNKGQIKDTGRLNRRDSIISVLRTKGPSDIKNISTVIRDVSEKTIQRELSGLVADGTVSRSGERRWSVYALTNGESA